MKNTSARTTFAAAVTAGVVLLTTGCVSVSSSPAEETAAAPDPYVDACDSFREYTDLFFETDVNFELKAARAQVAADDFDLLVSEHPEVASYVQSLRSIVNNQGKYADDLTVYSDLLDFCKKHPSE